jgi:hypothetical protein
LPFSPNTSWSSSLAPLTTSGWPVKSGALATKPRTFTIRLIRDSPPATSAAAASAFSAHSRASRAASSGLTPAPTLPVPCSLPSTIGSWPET